LEDLRALSNADLETRHDCIQFMFPSTDVSQYNSVAPVVTNEVIECFKGNKNLRDELLLNLHRILEFWDFAITEENDVIKFLLKPEFMGKPSSEVIFRNTSKFHNFLRLTRVIKSLHILGLEHYALALKKFAIETLKDTIKVPLTTVKFWKDSIPDTVVSNSTSSQNNEDTSSKVEFPSAEKNDEKEIEISVPTEPTIIARSQTSPPAESPTIAKFIAKAEQLQKLSQAEEAEKELNEKIKAEEELNAKIKAEDEHNAKIKAEEELNAKIKAEEELNAKIKAEKEALEKIHQEELKLKAKLEQEANIQALNEKEAQEAKIKFERDKIAYEKMLEEERLLNAKIEADAKLDAKLKNSIEHAKTEESSNNNKNSSDNLSYSVGSFSVNHISYSSETDDRIENNQTDVCTGCIKFIS